MEWFEVIPQSLKELRKLVQEFGKAPFPSTKALVIFAIIVACLITQWSGYIQKVSYGWMIGGLFLVIIILLAVLRIAYRFDRQRI